MLEKFFEKAEPFEKETAAEVKEREKRAEEKKREFDWRGLFLALGVFFLALIPRLAVLFLVSDSQSPGWYDDTFHHWQVAYFSKTVGFKKAFLRLWDLKGMEYFWGLLHPLVLVFLFALTGSVNVLIVRLLSVFCGSLVITFLFLLVRRYFNLASALGVVLFACFMPVILYSDTVGMQEPLGLVLILAGLLVWPKKATLTGFLFALAGMVRAEYWLFGAGLFAAAWLSKKKFDYKVILGVGWLIPTLLYAKYLLNHTGNAIYPIYWNFLASVKGEWFADVPLPPGAAEAQLIARVVFVFGILGALWSLVKRPRFYLLFLLGFGNIFFLGFMLGFGAYIRGYVPRFWIDRLFAWPYMFVGALLAVFLLYWLPRRFKNPVLPMIFCWPVLIIILLVSQISWFSINKYAQEGKKRYIDEKKLAQAVAAFYQGGTILIPEDRPPFVYYLVNDYGVGGEKLLGQMFDPFFYFEKDSFEKWPDYRQEVIDWLKEFNVRLLVVYHHRERYQNLIIKEPQIFQFVKEIGPGIEVYEVFPG